MPAYSGRSASVDSYVLDAVGLAKGLGAVSGGCDLLTPDGLDSPQALTADANVPASGSGPGLGGRAVRRLPRPARVFLGDGRMALRARRMRSQAALLNGRRYDFVIQKHRRFHDAGLRVARRQGVPFVLKMDALEVREEASWGVRRPLWGPAVESIGERRLIAQADLVVPVSTALDAQVESLGVPRERRLVLDNGVDLDSFSPGPGDRDLRAAHDLQRRFVVGWVGGFRPFHGLSLVPDIARRLRDVVPEAVLCLVGTGDRYAEVARSVQDLRDVVRLVGPVPYERVPDWIRTFDAAVHLAEPGPYHYSPLKLYEYMACGRPVIASEVGTVADTVGGEGAGILVPSGDARAVVDAIAQLAAHEPARRRMGEAARLRAERLGGWDARASDLIAALRDRELIA